MFPIRSAAAPYFFVRVGLKGNLWGVTTAYYPIKVW